LRLVLKQHPEFENDVRLVRDWYESQRPGYGRELVDQLGNTTSGIEQFPFGFPKFQNDWRRAILVRFPFQIAYCVLEDEILLVGLGHLHESPEGFVDRLARRMPQ
jgi:hypothetical protein